MKARSWATAVVGLAAALGLAIGLSAASAGTDRVASAGFNNWASWGNTANNMRFTTANQITPDNVGQLGRAFTFDLNKAVPGIKKGQQTYPIVIDGVMYVTSGDDQVFAVNATTGDLIWHFTPYNLASFKNFGIVANRGVAVCDGKVFLLTLDMTIVALDQKTGNQVARVPIANAVPGAESSYGYSETSAPICAGHELFVGAAGSEYGVRGFIMAYNTSDLSPAWPMPFWTIPPANTEWRSAARVVGGCTVWTPSTVDLSSGTLYFGTAAASPAYYPSLRPGNDPRCTSLVAVDMKTGQLEWWKQLIAQNQWSYDASQPPLVYQAKVGGKVRKIVSIASMEGMWFAFDAKTGAPIWQRIKVIDNVEHPALQPGKPVAIYPSSLGGLNYSPASFDPQTGYVYNAAAETASALQQDTPTEEKAKQLVAGNVYLGLSNGDFGQYLQNGWKDYGSVSAIDVSTGKRVWKFTTPQPERGGPTTTASGVGFVGGGDGTLRAFDVRTGKVLWTFQTGSQIADGPSVYTVNGTEYVAVGVGGTVTSSSGGTTTSQIQVFTLGGSKTESTAPVINGVMHRAGETATTAARHTFGHAAASHVTRLAAPTGSRGRLTVTPTVIVKPWDPNTSNQATAQGKLTLGGQPVQGAVLRVGLWTDPTPTGTDGSFSYPIDATLPARHVVTVVDVSNATVGGKKLSAADQKALLGRHSGTSVGYQVTNLKTSLSGDKLVVSGQLADSAGNVPPPVLLYTYLLSGKVTDSSGAPVKGAIVTTRTNDHKFWTQSRPTGPNGQYTSFLVPADEEGDDPVPMVVGVSVGGASWAEPLVDQIPFPALQSASLSIQLPAASGNTLGKSLLNPQPAPGAIFLGLSVGVTGANGKVIAPLSATWPDAKGNFTLTLPASAKGQKVTFWEAQRQFFSTAKAQPGGPIDTSVYPKGVASDAPQGLAPTQLG